jgi:cytoskeletal protein CcmA (bactofilin family)/Zn finger protein HypA/HybF involved in hydrogenase expression
VAAKGRIEVQCPHCGNIQLEPELAKSTYCRKCGGYVQLEKGRKTGTRPPEVHTTAKGRIEVQCAHCGNIQLEPELAKSTYCRKCGGYIQLEKGRKQGAAPPEIQKSPSVIQRLEGIFGVHRTLVARCFECPGKREVPKDATSTICPQCGSYIDLQDYRIVGNYSRSIRTRGRLFLTNKGDLNSNRVICEEADVQGHLRGSLVCNGEVRVRLKGKLSGSIEAQKVAIDRKAEVEFIRPIRANLIEIEGILAARIISDGKVVISKNGRLAGSVFARAFTVEKGGVFVGEVSIGKAELTQGELLDPVAAERTKSPDQDSGQSSNLAPA